MQKLEKHILKYDKVIAYFVQYLKEGNILSKSLAISTNFKSGDFYTILPATGIDVSRIYEFPYGGLLPRGEKAEVTIEGHVYHGFRQNTLTNILESLIYDIMLPRKNCIALFDDVIHGPNDPYTRKYGTHVITSGEQVYHMVSAENLTQIVIESSIHASQEDWHFVCAISDCASEFKVNEVISESDIRIFCKNISFIVVGAYDREGFVVWEKNKSSDMKL